jgi:peptidylprolyl isomerase
VKRQTAPLVVSLFAALALVAGGCGSSGGSSIQPAPSNAQTATAPTPATTPSSGPLASEPKIAKGSGPPPKKLVVRDLVKGTGAAARVGQTVTVNYVGVIYSSGKVFDASWSRGQPAQFQLSPGGLIQGWIEGVPGMRVGGRRELIIPPMLAYGPRGSGPIGPNQTLIFDIDLLAAQ